MLIETSAFKLKEKSGARRLENMSDNIEEEVSSSQRFSGALNNKADKTGDLRIKTFT